MKAILVNPESPAMPVNVDLNEIRSTLGCVSFAYPYDDPVCLAHDGDGIANQKPPNRTINGHIMPGSFYVLGINAEGDLKSLSPKLEKKYLSLFNTPEHFKPGHWKVTQIEHNAFISIQTTWEVSP
jgi:hypothetical protein